MRFQTSLPQALQIFTDSRKPLVVTKLSPSLRINPHNVPTFQLKAQNRTKIPSSKKF